LARNPKPVLDQINRSRILQPFAISKKWLQHLVPVAKKQAEERLQNVFGSHSGSDCFRERLAGVFDQNCQHFVASAISELVLNKVHVSEVIRMLRPEPGD
jgi:hypothetical protein